jgi:peptidoglycan/xylan/chitin deacetylase (PgdA/CDA1 family)
MRAGRLVGLRGLLLAAVLFTPGQAVACQPGADALGVARTIEINTAQGPRFGNQQYPEEHILRDREVVLTFDDGPHPAYTKSILDALDAHCTKATFFMVGWRALTQSNLVRGIARRGHTIGTHTWSHQNLANLDPAAARTEVELGISAVQWALGAPAAPFFRFPYLSDPRSMIAYVKSRNTGIFSIDVDSYDYRTRSPTMVVHQVMRTLAAKRKGIILMHDIQPSAAGAMKLLLAELKTQGYQVVHLQPTRGQTTVAEYDTQITRDYAGRKIASLPVPVGQRGVVAPAWEVNISPNAPNAGATAPRAARRDDDWRSLIFRGW